KKDQKINEFNNIEGERKRRNGHAPAFPQSKLQNPCPVTGNPPRVALANRLFGGVSRGYTRHLRAISGKKGG
ncbi:hypothetical protein, partial [Thalassovita autumnalis]|uniref:hypothetical protein n=1 Tax=Thalassovita autumnalis TaxID=2072972 RepID=UPI001A948514